MPAATLNIKDGPGCHTAPDACLHDCLHLVLGKHKLAHMHRCKHGIMQRLCPACMAMLSLPSCCVQAVKTFPEVLGLPVEQQLQRNVEKLKIDWKMTDKVIPNVVKRQPAVLGYNVDCEGNCQGDCNRCWVRF